LASSEYLEGKSNHLQPRIAALTLHLEVGDYVSRYEKLVNTLLKIPLRRYILAHQCGTLHLFDVCFGWSQSSRQWEL